VSRVQFDKQVTASVGGRARMDGIFTIHGVYPLSFRKIELYWLGKVSANSNFKLEIDASVLRIP
jgi:hypothetical protein